MPNALQRLGTAAGTAAGWAVAPAFGLAALVRRARVFHPIGTVLAARVDPEPEPGDPDLAALAERLAGPAIVRLSSALFRRPRWPDVLGCALRIRADAAPSSLAAPGDQDLLFATIRRPWTMPFAPVTTDVHDFLANDYYAVSPFDVPGVGRAYLRLRADRVASSALTRRQRLDVAIGQGRAVLHLELARSPRGPWRSVAAVALERRVYVDQSSLRFRPFRDGRGVRPRGLVHALRRGVYAVSQRERRRAHLGR